MAVLAIDQGTSATKAVVVDDGAVLATASAPVAVTAGADGAVESDPNELWESVLATGRRAVADAGEPTIDAVGLANQGETIVAWDRATGECVGPAIVWQDSRASVVCDELRAHAGALADLTGLALDPYFVAPKVTWLRRRLGRHLSPAGPVITTSDTWLLHRLCGAFTTDAATASRTLLTGLDDATWNDQACALFKIDADQLPTIVDNAAVVGETNAFARHSIPVSGTCVDQQAALFAQSCRRDGEAKCTYGTGAFLLATCERPVRSRSGLAGCVAWRLNDALTWCLDGQVFAVGAAVSWLERVGLIREPGDLDRVGGAVRDSGGVQFVPALVGMGAPFWRPNATASFTGMTMATERTHLVRAVVDGIAANVAWLARAVERDLGAPLTRLRVDGGLTRSRTLLQAQADVLQAPVEVYPSPDATALGVAAFARLGVHGGTAGDDSGVGAWTPAAVIEPSITADEANTRLHAWRAAADAALDRQ